MFKNIPIVTRLIFLVGTITLIMLATIIYATTNGVRSLDRLHDDMQQTLDDIQAFDRVNYLQARNRAVLLDALANPEPGNVEQHIEVFLSTRAEVTANAKRYEAGVKEGKDRELLDAWKAARIAYARENDNFMTALKAGKIPEAIRISQEKLTPLYEPISIAIANIGKYNLEQQEKRTEEVKAATLRTQYSSIAIVVLLMLVSGFLAWTIIRAISTPLKMLQSTIYKIASGDTKARANLKSRDELGQLAKQFDKMMDERETVQAGIQKENDALNDSVLDLLQAVAQLSRKDLTVKVPVSENVTGALADAINLMAGETAKVMAEVSNISADVTKASMSVQAQAGSMLTAAELDRDEVAKTGNALQTAAQSMRTIANLAQACNTVADSAIKSTQLAFNTVNSAVSGINSTRDVIRETEKRIKRLGERSQEISGVVNLINVIAERTHILALNASMHAASAGEAGRGFAVVADEVQRLAENARQATQQISALVSNIQLETADTVSTMSTAIAQIVEGSRLAEQAGQQMQLTQQTTSELVASVKQIASTSETQAIAGQDLLVRSDHLRQSSEKATAQLHEQASQTNNLMAYAKQLLSTVRVFKLPD